MKSLFLKKKQKKEKVQAEVKLNPSPTTPVMDAAALQILFLFSL